MTDLLNALRKNPEFAAVLKDALKHRPIVPQFTICKTKDEQDMIVETIKYYTALRNGWDALYQYLTGENPNIASLKEIQGGKRAE